MLTMPNENKSYGEIGNNQKNIRKQDELQVSHYGTKTRKGLK